MNRSARIPGRILFLPCPNAAVRRLKRKLSARWRSGYIPATPTRPVDYHHELFILANRDPQRKVKQEIRPRSLDQYQCIFGHDELASTPRLEDDEIISPRQPVLAHLCVKPAHVPRVAAHRDPGAPRTSRFPEHMVKGTTEPDGIPVAQINHGQSRSLARKL